MIKCEKVSKCFSNHTKAVQEVSFQVKDGEFVALVGKSGSGKSTLLNMIGLTEPPTEGHVFLDDVDIWRATEKEQAYMRNQKLGYIFQSFFLENAYTVYKNVEIPLLIANVPAKQRRERILTCLDKVGLLHKEKELARNLSGGEQQRVSIARALVNNPDILLADEPCGNLDSENTTNIMLILSQLHKEGKTILLVTHSGEEADYAERKIMLKDGRVVNDETKRNC